MAERIKLTDGQQRILKAIDDLGHEFVGAVPQLVHGYEKGRGGHALKAGTDFPGSGKVASDVTASFGVLLTAVTGTFTGGHTALVGLHSAAEEAFGIIEIAEDAAQFESGNFDASTG